MSRGAFQPHDASVNEGRQPDIRVTHTYHCHYCIKCGCWVTFAPFMRIICSEKSKWPLVRFVAVRRSYFPSPLKPKVTLCTTRFNIKLDSQCTYYVTSTRVRELLLPVKGRSITYWSVFTCVRMRACGYLGAWACVRA